MNAQCSVINNLLSLALRMESERHAILVVSVVVVRITIVVDVTEVVGIAGVGGSSPPVVRLAQQA